MEHNEKINILANSIKNARKIMEKVESGTIQPQETIRKRVVTEEDVDALLNSNNDLISESQMVQNRTQSPQMRNLSKSKMPEAILKSFQENPIIDPTAPVGMESMMNEISKKVSPVINEERVQNTIKNQIPQSPQMDIKLIEYIVKKTVEETLQQVTNNSTISENIQIKIGDKTFGGKITTLKEIKK
jgi:hypothetical protein